MSLWEVDDKATALMMESFYKNLIKGKSKRESFKIAQGEVRNKYSDARYWAAFIMLD
jgi:CHAT domain-containing protein